MRLSRRFARCFFAIGYSDPNADAVGGHLIRAGRCRSFAMTEGAQEEYFRRAGYVHDSDADDNEDRFWDADYSMLKACVDHALRGMHSWKKSSWSWKEPEFRRARY